MKTGGGNLPNFGAADSSDESDSHAIPGMNPGGAGDEAPADDSASPESKRKISTGTLVLLGLMAVGGGALWFFYMRPGPQAALASAQDPAAVNAGTTISQFLSEGKRSVARMKDVLDSTWKVVARFKDYPNAAQIPLSSLKANPFHYVSLHADAGVAPDAAEKTAAAAKEKERLEILKGAQSLQLQSVMKGNGAHKACMINNKLYKEGQQVGPFTIEKIDANVVYVKAKIYHYRLEMQK